MLTFLRTLRRFPLVVVFVALGVLAVHPTWASAIGVDVWNLPALKEQLRESTDTDERLNEDRDDVRRRIEVKELIIADLIARRTTLAEATERFTVLNESRPQYLTVIRSKYPGETDQEKMARNVIGFAQLRVAPAERDALNRRLEMELRQMLASRVSH